MPNQMMNMQQLRIIQSVLLFCCFYLAKISKRCNFTPNPRNPSEEPNIFCYAVLNSLFAVIIFKAIFITSKRGLCRALPYKYTKELSALNHDCTFNTIPHSPSCFVCLRLSLAYTRRPDTASSRKSGFCQNSSNLKFVVESN